MTKAHLKRQKEYKVELINKSINFEIPKSLLILVKVSLRQSIYLFVH